MSYTEKEIYWNEKHQNPNWSDEIHFSEFFENEMNELNFNKGIINNTEITSRLLLNHLSVFSFSNNTKIIDFACGKGDLLLRLAEHLPSCHSFGIDISEYAISKFTEKVASKKLTDCIKPITGSIESLRELNESYSNDIDIIICRDAFYMLTPEEQSLFFKLSESLLKETGILYIADSAVNINIVDTIKKHVIKRQHGGAPITWSINGSGRNFSISDKALGTRLDLISNPIINEDVIYKSFGSAAKFCLSSSTKNAYENLSEIAKPQKIKNQRISDYIYAKFIFCKTPIIKHSVSSSILVKFSKNFSYQNNETIINKGLYSFEIGKWNLVLGQSGVGKTTILKYIAEWYKNKNIDISNKPKKVFLLEQNPKLIEDISVKSNLILFNNNEKIINQVLINLGLPQSILKRVHSRNKLSGGEYQRIALAQAVISEPDLLLLDEPCTGMDQVKKYQFFSNLKSYYVSNEIKSPTIIAVDHEFNSIESFFNNYYEIIHQRIYAISK
ncbi:ATP-binding cassette domain-containing protein [Lentimicrobium sp. L6]|uniref:ATP-binding cassette domain-containing protein n=1 Tax=Lentimicrobium sp. L6 TaxID=2735916 RepID=UPI001556EB04|nr:ATP-binding cassette domain-containing protein [Lentimicrobium sp. L6]NPD85147.1 ATP-binding cassette domain-containing protein [Lentimicrobium sp. L6]